MKPPLLLATLVALAALCACAGATSSSSDSRGAITRYVAAEDNDFADLRGTLQRSNSTTAYYSSRQTMPGSSGCVVYVDAGLDDHFGGCRFDAADLHAATTLYHRWLANVQAALPQWKSFDVRRLPKGDVAATIFTDAGEIHGVYVDIFGDAESGYRVTTTFAKMSVLRS
jgi:hypothetical protein